MDNQMILFSDNPQEELTRLGQELRLGSMLKHISDPNLPQDVKDDIRQSLALIADLFGNNMPHVEEDPIEALKTVARDMNLASVLRNRGIFRLYRMLMTPYKVVDGETGEVRSLPVYATMQDTDTGEYFRSQEDFIRWFSRTAKISRSLIFLRIGTMDRLRDLGFSLDEIYQFLIRPTAMHKVLSLMGQWEKNKLVSVDPAVAIRLAEKMLPDALDDVVTLADQLTELENPDDIMDVKEEITEKVRPAIAGLIREVASHPSAKDAIDMVAYDIARKAEIRYKWDTEADCLVVTYVRKAVDIKGTEYVADVQEIPFVPSVELLPKEVRDDLVKRLPIINRDSLI